MSQSPDDPAVALLLAEAGRMRREHHRGKNWHPAPAQMQISGVDDARTIAALRARAALEAVKLPVTPEQEQA